MSISRSSTYSRNSDPTLVCLFVEPANDFPDYLVKAAKLFVPQTTLAYALYLGDPLASSNAFDETLSYDPECETLAQLVLRLSSIRPEARILSLIMGTPGSPLGDDLAMALGVTKFAGFNRLTSLPGARGESLYLAYVVAYRKQYYLSCLFGMKVHEYTLVPLTYEFKDLLNIVAAELLRVDLITGIFAVFLNKELRVTRMVNAFILRETGSLGYLLGATTKFKKSFVALGADILWNSGRKFKENFNCPGNCSHNAYDSGSTQEGVFKLLVAPMSGCIACHMEDAFDALGPFLETVVVSQFYFPKGSPVEKGDPVGHCVLQSADEETLNKDLVILRKWEKTWKCVQELEVTLVVGYSELPPELLSFMETSGLHLVNVHPETLLEPGETWSSHFAGQKVVAILPGRDQDVPLTAQIAQGLALPCEAPILDIHKRLIQAGIPYLETKSFPENRPDFPCVADGVKCFNMAELVRLGGSKADEEPLRFRGFYEGQEFCVYTVSFKGYARALAVFLYESSQSMEHLRVQTVNFADHRRITGLAEKTVSALGIKGGPCRVKIFDSAREGLRVLGIKRELHNREEYLHRLVHRTSVLAQLTWDVYQKGLEFYKIKALELTPREEFTGIYAWVRLYLEHRGHLEDIWSDFLKTLPTLVYLEFHPRLAEASMVFLAIDPKFCEADYQKVRAFENSTEIWRQLHLRSWAGEDRFAQEIDPMDCSLVVFLYFYPNYTLNPELMEQIQSRGLQVLLVFLVDEIEDWQGLNGLDVDHVGFPAKRAASVSESAHFLDQIRGDSEILTIIPGSTQLDILRIANLWSSAPQFSRYRMVKRHLSPHHSYRHLHPYLSAHNLRSLLQFEVGFSSVDFQEALKYTGLPCVVRDETGSHPRKNFKGSAQPEEGKKLLVQEYVAGQTYLGICLSRDGTHTCHLYETFKLGFQLGALKPLQEGGARAKELHKFGRRLLDCLEVVNGVSTFEAVLMRDGRACLLDHRLGFPGAEILRLDRQVYRYQSVVSQYLDDFRPLSEQVTPPNHRIVGVYTGVLPVSAELIESQQAHLILESAYFSTFEVPEMSSFLEVLLSEEGPAPLEPDSRRSSLDSLIPDEFFT